MGKFFGASDQDIADGRTTDIYFERTMKVLEERLKARGSESRGSLEKRLKVARQELKEAKYYDHVIINADLNKALEKLQKIVCSKLGIKNSLSL